MGRSMPMLACTHHVAWIKPVAGGKHQCTYCKAAVAKKEIYPKFEDLGPTFQAQWDAHEKTGPAPAPKADAPAAAH